MAPITINGKMGRAMWYVVPLCLTVIGPPSLKAQPATLSGPLSGVVFDQNSNSIRPIVGVPGAAYLGSALVREMDAAAVAPSGGWALAVKEKKLRIYRIDAAGAALDETAGFDDPASLVWNRNSSAAVLYSKETKSMALWRAGSGEPTAAIDLSALPGNVLALTLDAAGDWCYVAIEEDGVYAVGLRGQGVPRLLHKTPRATALALAEDGRELFIAERSQIWRVANVVEAPETSLFADLGEAEFDPVALVAETRTQRLYVAAQKAKLLVSLNTTDTTVVWRTALDFEPAGLAALTDQSLFALNAGANAGGPIQVLQTGESPAVYFVPAGREDSGPEE